MTLFWSIFLSVFLVVATAIIFYEVLRIAWNILPTLTIAPRKRVVFLVVMIFAGHTIAVWLYALVFWLLSSHSEFGYLVGLEDNSFLNFLYFSGATYTSLGYGDVYPKDGLRFLAGVEALNGLIMIGWSVSLTYLAMQKFWDLHGPFRWRKRD